MQVGDRVEGAFRVSTGEWLGFTGQVVRVTEKAVLLEGQGQRQWCPRSTCKRVRG
jgi:hypothetical protein